MQVTMMPKQPSMPLSEVQPDPQLEKRSRRVFTTDYKLKILAQADQCAHGELGPLLRREKLYSNQLQQWRKESVPVDFNKVVRSIMQLSKLVSAADQFVLTD
jgi:hypothetical protein